MREGKVLTPFGFKPVGNISVGDKVCNPDGTVAQVIAVHDRPELPFYRLTFIDGATVEVDEDHLWPVWYSSSRKATKTGVPVIPAGMRPQDEWNARHQTRCYCSTTRQLAKALQDEIERGEEGDRPYWPLVPLTAPCKMTASPGKWPMLPPYLYGVLLGDGSMTKLPVQWSKPDAQIAELVLAEIKANNLPWYITRSDTDERCPVFHVRDQKAAGERTAGENRENNPAKLCERVGLLGKRSWEKSIHSSYLNGPIEKRAAVLRGLLDTDGSVDDRGHVEYSSSSEQLAKDVQYLARSLGFTATSTCRETHYVKDGEEHPARLSYRLYIKGRDTSMLFSLDRKRERCRAYNGGVSNPGRRLVSIEQTESSPSRCITVDNPNGLFITDDFIVTHNSDLILGLSVNCHQQSLILRREAVQLTNLVERIKLIVGRNGAWRSRGHGGDMRISKNTPCAGGKAKFIELAGCEKEDDKLKFTGRPHDLLAFDELPTFSPSQYRMIIGWNRSSDPSQRCRVVATGNPPTTPEGRWVVEEWAPWLEQTYPDPAVPGELRWYTYIDKELKWFGSGEPIIHKGETIRPRSRTFIPARLSDNPVYYQEGKGEYIARLQAMPEPLRSQLLYGDFTAGTDDPLYQVIPTAWVRAAQQRWLESAGRDYPLSCIGVDVARGGSNKTVLALRRGIWVAPLLKYPGRATPDSQAGASLIKKALGSERADTMVHIDGTGVGASVYDKYREYSQARVRAIINSTATRRRDRAGVLTFANLRAWSYWYLREALDPESGDGIMLPPDPELLADLCAPHYDYRPSGILIEDKDRITQRIGRSPDCGDAIVLAMLPPTGWEAPTTVEINPVESGDSPGLVFGQRSKDRSYRRRLFGGR